MNTRRSWKNQNRLFKELFKPEQPVCVPVVSPVCFNCVEYPGKRMHAVCRRSGRRVSGSGQHPCFTANKETTGKLEK